MWGSGGFANKEIDQLFRVGLRVSAGCWHTAHEPGNITMRLRCICGQPLWVRCPDAIYFSMTTTHSDQCCQLHCLPGALERAQRSCHLAKHLVKSDVWHSVSASLDFALIMAMLSLLSFNAVLSVGEKKEVTWRQIL